MNMVPVLELAPVPDNPHYRAFNTQNVVCTGRPHRDARYAYLYTLALHTAPAHSPLQMAALLVLSAQLREAAPVRSAPCAQVSRH